MKTHEEKEDLLDTIFELRKVIAAGTWPDSTNQMRKASRDALIGLTKTVVDLIMNNDIHEKTKNKMNKKYQIIYADPPWDYKGQGVYKPGKGIKDIHSSAINHYPTMKLNDMISVFRPQLDEWSDDNCLLYMWTSSPHLDQSIKLAEGWGFNYATVAFVWYKQNVNPGFYTMSQCELCLVFKKGKIPQPRGIRNAKQFVSEKAREHSRKPNEVRERIELMHPSQNKLEMFTRQTYDGWDAFGNQTTKFDSKK